MNDAPEFARLQAENARLISLLESKSHWLMMKLSGSTASMPNSIKIGAGKSFKFDVTMQSA